MRRRNILFSLIMLGFFTVGLSACNTTANTSSSETEKFTIIWKNHDGTILDVDNVNYGTTPIYDGETPLKASSDIYTYTFYGWYPEVVPVTGNATYTAQFTSLTNQYLITFKNYDGTSLQTSNWPHGSTPVYSGVTPTKSNSSQYSYTFRGWSPEIVPVTGTATYTAQFTSSTNRYLITFKNYDGTVLQSSNWAYGSIPIYSGVTPTKSKNGQYSYTFKDWSPSIAAVTGDATYIAIFIENYYLGSYPQTKVTDVNLITTLNNSAGGLPTPASSKSWTPYNYYIFGSNTTKFMWYKDISIGEDLYRGVFFTSYRPDYADSSSSANNSYQDDNGYLINNRYWFKFEPISWDVLSVVESAGPLLFSSKIIDSQEYYHSTTVRTIGGNKIYPNNYKESNIRTWLNNGFLNTAFSSTEQNLIKTTNVDNSLYSTGDETNQYTTTNTNDKLFLPSYRDVVNADYGFSTSRDSRHLRKRSATDYAKAMGINVFLGNSDWWLRSPNSDDGEYVFLVDDIGVISMKNSSFTCGVLPAFRINR